MKKHAFSENRKSYKKHENGRFSFALFSVKKVPQFQGYCEKN